MRLKLGCFLAFLDGDDLPDPNSMSTVSSRMLNVTPKPVECVTFLLPIQILTAGTSVLQQCWRLEECEYALYVL
jgi:hypothetical protein